MTNKCLDSQCDRRANCKRFTEPPEKNQQYFKASPRWLQECDFYISNGTNPQEQREEDYEERQSFIQDVMN
jgi:hypothetical protein